MSTATLPRTHGQRLVLYGISWNTYVRLLQALQDRHLRITYDRGALEIMTLSFGHEKYSQLLALFVMVLADEFGMPVSNAGSVTLKRRRMKRGLEPDKCFYLRNEPFVRGKQKLDLRIDPPPDLAVEVDVTHSSLNRMGIYARLGVPEVWRFDGEAIRVYLLGPDRKYAESPSSPTFPTLSVDKLTEFVRRCGEIDDLTLMREFRSWVREHAVP